MRLDGIQVLRAVAAISVMLAHAVADIAARSGVELVPRAYAGAAGVDLFFVISGFIMVYSSRDLLGRPGAWLAFSARRLARIVPLYWAVTLIYLLLQIVQGKWQVLKPDWIAASLLFIPFDGGTGAGLSPFYGIGWTLNFEMMFYGVFALALALGGRHAFALVATGLTAAVALGALVALPRLPAYWANEIVLDFVMGVLIGMVFLRGFRFPPPLAVLLVIAGLGGLLTSTISGFNAALPDQPPAFPRVLAWGLPMGLIVAGVSLVHGTPAAAPSPARRALLLLGDMSYAIYLLHPIVIVALRPVLPLSIAAFGPLPAALLQLAIILGSVIALSVVAFSKMEKPITIAAARMLRRRDASSPSAI